uniref:Uncharacterized protein n=2 Tax=Amphimedon queenslandica TaxID=400682 RepID=A0A1X7T8Z9_AMPQE
MSFDVIVEGACTNQYSKRSSNNLCSLKVPNGLLYLWYLQKPPSIIAALSNSIAGKAVQVSEAAERLKKRMMSKAGEINSLIKRSNKREKEKIRAKYSLFGVMKDEVMSFDHYNDIIKEKDKTIKDLQHIIHRKTISSEASINSGKGICDVEARQRKRKIATLKESCKNALWFTGTYDINLVDISYKSSDDKKLVLKYNRSPLPSITADSVAEAAEGHGSQEILDLLDRFGVSDEFYHELTMLYPELPRSYLIKKERSKIVATTDIRHLPKPHEGCYIQFEQCLVDTITNFEDIHSPVEIKLSGDGAPFTRLSSFIILSFSLPSLDFSLSSTSNYTFAVIKGKESYHLMKEELAPVLVEVNQIIQRGYLIIKGKRIEINLLLGGDYKFLLMTMGLKEASSNFACLYCEIHKDKRWDITFEAKERSLSSLVENAKKKQLGVSFEPLFKLEMTNIVIDELHVSSRNGYSFEKCFMEDDIPR